MEAREIAARLYAHANPSFEQAGRAVLADIDGQAHRNIYGVVAVLPVENIPGLGREHGKMYKDGAIQVDQDVGDGSQLECTADLRVFGGIHSASITVAGNIHIGVGADNPAQNNEAYIRAGQSVYAHTCKDTQVWTGS